MSKINKVYKCEVCGNIVELIHAGGGTLYCCNKPMVELVENSTDAAKEKHVPIVEKLQGQTVVVKVGSVEHPMTEEHDIEWIEVLTDNDGVHRKYLKPTESPMASFLIGDEIHYARAYCNLHGLWKSK